MFRPTTRMIHRQQSSDVKCDSRVLVDACKAPGSFVQLTTGSQVFEKDTGHCLKIHAVDSAEWSSIPML